MNSRKRLEEELAACQQRLGRGGRFYWRSLEELADSDAFQTLVQQEFPEQADIWPDALSRRRFLTLMAASLALGGLGGCSVRPAPAEKIVPYVHPQQGLTPGRPLFYATTMTFGGEAVGLLVESHMGRPTKIEGNPDHPASLGATNPFHQASVLTLYDPDRSQTVTCDGQIRGWNDADQALRDALATQRSSSGKGLRILTETVFSPTLGQQLRDLLAAYPQAKWHQYEPVHHDNALQGSRWAFGEPYAAVYDYSQADVVLSLDADFLTRGPGHLRYARDYMAGRKLPWDQNQAPAAAMNRLWVVESAVTCTGAKADHRWAVRASEIQDVARSIAAALGIGQPLAADHDQPSWISAVARDLQSQRGRSLVVAGHRQPPIVHLLAQAINEQLGNSDRTVRWIAPVAEQVVACNDSLRELAEDIRQEQVEVLVILGGNPVYTAPADFEFSELMTRVPLRFHLSLYADETSRLCQWHLPQAHFLETWSDARAFDGTASIAQPLIEPLYRGRSPHEMVAAMANAEAISGDDIIRSFWESQHGAPHDFEEWWQTSLHDGLIADTAFKPKDLRLQDGWQKHLEQPASTGLRRPSAADLQIEFDADPTIYDGAVANNAWLQELPKPLTKLTWDNAALVSPATATRLGLKLGPSAHGGEHGGYQVPLIELQLDGRQVRAPVWIVPGHADDAITVHFGYGRWAAGHTGGGSEQPVGFNAFALRTSSQPWFAAGLKAPPTIATYQLACTQSHHALDGRDLVRAGTLEQFRSDPASPGSPVREHRQAEPAPALPASIYETADAGPPRRRWGMVIDMTACTGCSACIVACQSENNIPVVGKDQVLRGREMHWLRVDRYISGHAEAPEQFHFQPVPCMHCEHAPCEYVCPVAATVHSADGLNEMVYNRCVGTRFCSNNCPYKVRRFNFLAYSDFNTPVRRLQFNPDVTVRSRGVMEKCTYCVQRIRVADMDAEAGGRPLRDGEVLTACQAACPTQAIHFGDLADSSSDVARASASPLDYALLAELNTFPRTTYLAEIRNPHPELQSP